MTELVRQALRHSATVRWMQLGYCVYDAATGEVVVWVRSALVAERLAKLWRMDWE